MDILSYMIGKKAGGGGSEPVIEPLDIDENGTYEVEEGVDGYSPITVNVPNPSTGNINITDTQVTDVTNYATAQVVDADLIAENIKKDVNILGVTGTFEGGGGSAPSNDVNFFDYDGTIVASYSASDFLALSAMPDNPTHEGLISQGWNWSLSDAQSYVTSYGKLNIGQMYITDDNKTRIYITLGEGRLNPAMRFTVNSGTTTIDWGDGTTPVTAVSNAENTHTYAQAGDYVIKIDGDITINGDSYTYLLKKHNNKIGNENQVYTNSITKIELGKASIGTNAFYRCYSLQSITIPNSITSIGNTAFYSCYSLQSITIPNSVTSIGSDAFYECYSLQSVIFSNSMTSIGSSLFYGCSSLQSITIPNSVTSIGTNVFYSCYSLQSITIPNSVTSIGGNTFYSCRSLQSITIPNSVTSIGSNIFRECYSLQSLIIPNSVTNIAGSAFYECYSLQSVIFSNSMTSIGSSLFYGCSSLQSITIPNSITSIGNTAFCSCYSLQSVIIPNSVTSIGSNTFYSCYGLGSIKFESSTPPSASNSNWYSNVLTDCKIYVPTGSLSAYTSATNYPSSSTYTYVEY